MDAAQTMTEVPLPRLPQQDSINCEPASITLLNGISETSVVTTNSLPTHTKSFSPELTDSAMDDSPLSSSPQPPPVSPLTSPPPIAPPSVVAIVTNVQEPIKPATPIEAPPTNTPPVDNETNQNSTYRDLPLALLQANEELLSDEADPSGEDEADDNMDTQSEYDYPLPSTASSQSMDNADSPPDDRENSSSFPPEDNQPRASSSQSVGGSSYALSSEMSTNISPEKPSTISSSSHDLDSFGLDARTLTTPQKLQLPDNLLPAPLDMSTRNFPRRSRHAHRAAVYAMHPYHRATSRGGTGVGVAKTMELLKAVLQSSFNAEMKNLCDDYFKIFSLAAANISENTTETVPESTLRTLVCRMMEDAQHGYQNGRWDLSAGQLPKNDRVTASKGSPMSTKKPRTDREPNRYNTGSKRGRKPTEKATDNGRAAWKWGLDKRRLDPMKWSPEKLSLETMFVLGVNVNKALGHAANRGKVYLLHPELFKFVCDGDDKTWLYENKYLPVHGGKAFLMIFSEVEQLVETEELYRDNPEIVRSVEKLQRFRVPQFMLNKMKDFIKNVQGYFAQETVTNGAIQGSECSTSTAK